MPFIYLYTKFFLHCHNCPSSRRLYTALQRSLLKSGGRAIVRRLSPKKDHDVSKTTEKDRGSIAFLYILCSSFNVSRDPNK